MTCVHLSLMSLPQWPILPSWQSQNGLQWSDKGRNSYIPSLKKQKKTCRYLPCLKGYASHVNLPLQKLVSIITDGAPATVGSRNGSSLCRNNESNVVYIAYCIINQEALYTKVVNFYHVINVVTKIINSICSVSLKHRFSKLSWKAPYQSSLIWYYTLKSICWVWTKLF
jgi:hypothetical protein